MGYLVTSYVGYEDQSKYAIQTGNSQETNSME